MQHNESDASLYRITILCLHLGFDSHIKLSVYNIITICMCIMKSLLSQTCKLGVHERKLYIVQQVSTCIYNSLTCTKLSNSRILVNDRFQPLARHLPRVRLPRKLSHRPWPRPLARARTGEEPKRKSTWTNVSYQMSVNLHSFATERAKGKASVMIVESELTGMQEARQNRKLVGQNTIQDCPSILYNTYYQIVCREE